MHVGRSDADPTLRKALAIGADKALRIDTDATDGFVVANQIANFVKENPYDLIIAGRESIDYNGAMVPGLISGFLNINFVTNCTKLEFDKGKVVLEREIDGGKEILESELPLIIGGQKGLVEESDLRIPNMRGIMMARQKPLDVNKPQNINSRAVDNKFFKPEEKGEVKLVKSDELDKLIDLLENEAKVI